MAVFYGSEKVLFSKVPGVTCVVSDGALEPGKYDAGRAAQHVLRMKSVAEQVCSARCGVAVATMHLPVSNSCLHVLPCVTLLALHSS